METTSYFPGIAFILFESSRTEEMTILRKSKKLKKFFEIFRKTLKNKSFGEIFRYSHFLLFEMSVLFKNERRSEKWWGKLWRFKKKIGEQLRKTVENGCFGKIENRKNSKNPSRYFEKIGKIRALKKSQIFSFFAVRNVSVIQKSEKIWKVMRKNLII